MNARFLADIDETLARGDTGVVLTLNTNDRYVTDNSAPPVRLINTVARHLAREHGFVSATYSSAGGFEPIRVPGEDTEGLRSLSGIPAHGDSHEVFHAVGERLRADPSDHGGQRVAIIVDHADHLAPASPGSAAMLQPAHAQVVEQLHRLGTDARVRVGGHLVVLISHENGLHQLLRRSGVYPTVRVDLPSLDERHRFVTQIREERASGRVEFGALADDLDVDAFAEISGGLRLVDIERLFRSAAANDARVDRGSVVAAKSETINELGHGLVEVIEPLYGLDSLAGLPHLKEFVGECLTGEGLPSGLVLAGPPGQGKSHSVRAIAHEMGIPCLALRNIRSRWVGETEQNLESVLGLVESLKPCIVWIDELDQALGQRSEGASTDGGTNERVMARLWEYMGDTKSRRGVTWIGTTNRPDLIDPATLDRFGAVIPFLHPTPAEVSELLPAIAEQRRRTLDDDVDTRALAHLPALRLPTVRSLHEVVGTAGRWADSDAGEPGAPVRHGHLEEAAVDVKRSHDLQLHEMIALTALAMTTRHSLLPWRSRRGRRTGIEPPAYATDLLWPDGRLDEEALAKRVEALRAERRWATSP